MARKARLAAAAAVLTAVCCAFALGGTASGVSHRAIFPPMTYTDESGDNGTAADVRTITVTNDDTGRYTIDIAYGTPYTGTDGTLIFLDTDANPATGFPDGAGADYLLVEEHANRAFAFEKWDRSQFVDAPSAATIEVSVLPGDHFVFSFNKSEVDDSTAFNFSVVSIDGDGSAGHADGAPSGSGTYFYRLQVLELTPATSSQSAARAGGTWTLVLAVRRSDTGAAVGPEGTIACHASGGGVRLHLLARGFVSSGGAKAASCRFRVPTKLKHKVLRGTMRLGYQGLFVTHAYTTHVK
jgi:hypothetical protein